MRCGRMPRLSRQEAPHRCDGLAMYRQVGADSHRVTREPVPQDVVPFVEDVTDACDRSRSKASICRAASTSEMPSAAAHS